MANPFLFDAPTGAPPSDNPFLAGAAAPVDNPFLQSAAQPQPPMSSAAPQMMAPQAQYGMFGQPQMVQQTVMHTPPVMAAQAPVAATGTAAANPFADFTTAAPPPASSGAAMFGVPRVEAPVAPAPTQAAAPHQEPEPTKEKVSEPTLTAAPVEEKVPPAPVDNPFLQTETKEEDAPPPPAQVESPVKPNLDAEKADAAADVPLPPPPPEESSHIKEDEFPPPPPPTQVEPEPQPEPQEEPQVGESEPQANETVVASTDVPMVDPISPQAEESSGPSQGASLFGLPAEPELKTEADEDNELEEGFRTKMTTGDAIFSDLPAAGPSSTGANLFGTSEESAAGSTGASIFDVAAPRAALPQLGEMSGWDDDFDAKFNEASAGGGAGGFANASAAPIFPGDPTDPFAGTGAGLMPGASASGFGTGDFNPSTKPTSFGDEANPFVAGAAAAGKQEGEADSPLFDDDTSKPLESFPRINIQPEGWEFFIRHPPIKKLTAQRYWKKIWVKLVMQGDTPCVQLYENKDAKQAFQEVPLQVAYSLSEIGHQVFDQYSKIFTLKVQHITYKEQAGIRPGQITKMQKLTDKIGFLAKAVEDADYKGVKEFASDMKKLGVPIEHAPQIAELLKLGSEDYETLKQFSVCVEEKLFRMDAHRVDRAIAYKTEEVQLAAVDEVYVEQDKTGHVIKQLCRVRVFFLCFLSDMPDIELGVNDIVRMGLEVVGRHDILPVPTEQWIRYEDIEFHKIIDKKAFKKEDHIIKFQPPDGCYVELLRFRVRPPRARELPMQARCQFIISGNRVEIRADMMIPYPHTKAWGQVPCEDVAMRIPLPECWIYQFRTEKHHMTLSQLATGNLNLGTRMGSVKSAHRRAGKVKGLERFMGTMETHTDELMETSSGQAKYEHQHKAIVWRVPRLPKQGQGSYTNHEFVCKLRLTSYDQMPETFEKHFYVEFTQPATAISNTVLRSVSIQPPPEEPPEKFVKYLARHEYKLEIDFAEKEQNTYAVVTKKVEEKQAEPEPEEKEYPDFPDENGERRFSESDSD